MNVSTSEWTCPRCGLEGERRRSLDPSRCRTCLRTDAAEVLYSAAAFARGVLRRLSEARRTAGLDAALNRLCHALDRAEGRT